MNKYYKKIIDYMMDHPGKYIKIDDVRIDLLVPCKPYPTNFNKAWQDLIACGKLESCGNSIKIKQ